MEIVKQVPAKARKPGRPRAIPEEIEPIVVELYNRGYGYRPIARILRTTNNPLPLGFKGGIFQAE